MGAGARIIVAAALLLAAATARAETPCAASVTSLGIAIKTHLEARVDLEKVFGRWDMVEEYGRAFLAATDERVALTGPTEAILLYTYLPGGMCLHVLAPDDSGALRIADAFWSEGQVPEAVSAALAGLAGAMGVDRRMLSRQAVPLAMAGMRSAVPLAEEAGSGTPAQTVAEAAAALARLLSLDPAAPRLAAADEVLVIPSQDIGTVPFALLPAGGRALIDGPPVTIVPSVHDLAGEHFAQGYTVARALAPIGFTPDWQAAVVLGDPEVTGDPDWRFPALPGARAEARLAASTLGTEALIGAEAQLSTFRAAIAPETTLIYLAAHGIASQDDPLNASFVALAGGRLTARDVLTLGLESYPLVILSACQSGLGQSHSGGTIGLSRAFIMAGAGAVVASLWSVDDAATAELMTDFLAGIGRDRPAAALWQAMRLARDRHPDDPALWAGFSYFGSISAFVEG